jgi:DNA-binding FrmR family transcriptional regulator
MYPPQGGMTINEIKNMKNKFKKQILNRISYLSGHLEGIKKMVEKDKYCIDVLWQSEAVIAALKKMNELILENHLNTCVTEAIKGKNEKDRKKKIRELLEVFKNSNK